MNENSGNSPKTSFRQPLHIKEGPNNASFRQPQHIEGGPTNRTTIHRKKPSEFLNSSPSIEDGTPAAAALKAIQTVKVTKLDKFARKIRGPQVKKFVKNAAKLNHTKRGKPPRVSTKALERGMDEIMKDLRDEDFSNRSVNEMDPELLDDGKLHGTFERTHSRSQSVSSMPLPINDDCVGEEFPVDDISIFPNSWSCPVSPPSEKLSPENPWRQRNTEAVKKEEVERKPKKKKHLKGKVIDGEHELYALSIAMMLGLRTSIGMTNGKLASAEGKNRWLNTDDFMAVEKYSFRPKGGEKTPPHDLSHTFKFKDYSPMVFAYIRRLFGVNEYSFLSSVCGNANFIEFISNAKSGQFFFLSADGKYMIKTMTDAESKFLRRILPHYFRHCSLNPNTLITKFFGMYRVKMYHLRRNTKFLIMNYVPDTYKSLSSVFDLKGSVTGRHSGPEEGVKKDNNVRDNLTETGFFLCGEVKERLRKQVVSDCEFLKEMKIMDYSMLIGVHRIPAKTRQNLPKDSSSRREDITNSKSIREILLKKTHAHSSIRGLKDKTSVTPLDESNSFDDVDRFDPYLDDDDASYLDGVNQDNNYTEMDPTLSITEMDIDVLKLKKEYATEQMYWPFHKCYDIQGNRRMYPSYTYQISRQIQMKSQQTSSNGNGLANVIMNGNDETENSKISTFDVPLSKRRDSGFCMDVSGIETLLTEQSNHNGKKPLYEGKIFYMGIIDLLQQFNIRKRIEAKYRRSRGSGWEDASCVHPNLYADRFIRFFDQYTSRQKENTKPVKPSPDDIDSDSENVEEIIFEDDKIESIRNFTVTR